MYSKLLKVSTDLENWTVAENDEVSKAFLLMNEYQRKEVYVLTNSGIVSGVISESDIIRCLINKVDIYSLKAKDISIKNYCYVNSASGFKAFDKDGIVTLPILDDYGHLVSVSCEPSLFCTQPARSPTLLIMAGGKGLRLGDLTRTIPKPLMKIGELTFLELVIGYGYKFGVREFIISVNYLKSKIKNFVSDLYMPGASFKVIEEPDGKYLGTAGILYSAISLCSNNQMVVSNADLFINEKSGSNLSEAFTFSNKNTIICTEYEQLIPFGVVHEKDNRLTKVVEKPISTSLIAAGIYSFNIDDLKKILVKDDILDMPDLVNLFMKNKLDINILRLINCDWIDIGTKEQLMAARSIKIK